MRERMALKVFHSDLLRIVTILLPLVGLWLSTNGFGMNLQRVTHIGQSIDAVVADGNYAYIGEGAGLRVLDVSNPANPQPLGRVSLLAFCECVRKKENFVFCALLDKGMQVVDVSNPQLPQVVYTYDTSWSVDGGVWWHDLEIEGNRLYATSGSGGPSGIHCFDITSPSSPSFLGKFSDILAFSWLPGIGVKDNFVYAAAITTGSIQIVDFSNPAFPSEEGQLSVGGPFSVIDVLLEGNRAYVAGSAEKGLMIYDTSNPVSPSFLGRYDTPNVASRIVKSGNYLYVTDMWDTPGVVVVNVSDPTNPTFQSSLNVQGTALNGIWVDSNRLYVASLTHLSIFSLSNPANPALLGSYSQRDALGHSWGVRAKDGFLYVADSRMGLKIFDVSNPSDPEFLGKYRVSSEAEGIEVLGNVAYVCNVWGRGIEAINVADKTNPQLLTKLTFPGAGNVTRASISGNYLYAVGSEGGVYVVDISNPSTPVYTNRFDTDGIAQDLAIVGDALFVADGNAGVKVLDLTNAPTLSLLTSITNIGNVVALDVDGPRAIICVRGPSAWEVRSYDISNVASPAFQDSLLSWGPNDVKVSGDYAIVQNHKAGVWAYDISDLSNLMKVSEFDTEASADRGIDIEGEYIYSCDWLGGLNVFTVSGGLGAPTATPTPTFTSTDLPPSATPTPTLTSTDIPPSETSTPTFTSTELPPSATPTSTEGEGILGDLNRNGKVGPEDLLLFLQNWDKTQE